MKKILMVSLFLTCCSSGTVENTPADYPLDLTLPESRLVDTMVPVCVDDSGETLTCSTNKDCCDGFECSFDPEGSYSQKYCLYRFEEKPKKHVR